MTRTLQNLRLAAVLLSLAAIALPAMAERGDDANRKSKNGNVSATIDGVEVTIDYGRPTVKERGIWGGLVPLGEVWRTGADEATTITFSAPVTIQGQPLAAGTYSLFTLPEEEQWTVIFNTVAEQWGAFEYDSAKDALRVQVEPEAAEHTEVLTFSIEGPVVTLRWEKVAVSFTVATAG